MRKILIAKPQCPLGEKIGQVSIVERKPSDDWYRRQGITSLFDILTRDGNVYRAFFWSLDSTLGYCHQNLIPIEKLNDWRQHKRAK